MIYADANATSPLKASVKNAMLEAMVRFQANPNSAHFLGQEARHLIEETRQIWAELLGVKPAEIIFTASASESNFLWLWNLYLQNHGKKLILSPFEHSSVAENASFLSERFGLESVEAPLSSDGSIDCARLESLLDNEGPWLGVSVIGAHNESGLLQPWKEIAALCAERALPFHSDLVQHLGRLPLSLHEPGLSAATLGFHKMGGPKGLGMLVVKGGRAFEGIMKGGGQENKRRPGTENIVAIAGLKALASEVNSSLQNMNDHVRACRNSFEEALRIAKLPLTIVGETAARLPNTSFLIARGYRADSLLMNLSLAHICASSGSACSSGLLKPSKVAQVLGFSPTEALSTLRFSFTEDIHHEDGSQIVTALASSLQRALRLPEQHPMSEISL